MTNTYVRGARAAGSLSFREGASLSKGLEDNASKCGREIEIEHLLWVDGAYGAPRGYGALETVAGCRQFLPSRRALLWNR